MHLSVSLFFQPSIDLSSYPWVYLDEFFGVQWITDAAARSCAMNDGCWYAIVRSEKTHTLACNDCRVLMCHRAVRKNKHAGPQRIPSADVPSCGQKRHVYLSIYRSNSLSLSIYIYISLSLSLSICLSVYLSVYVSTHLFLYLSWYLYNYLSLCLCIYLSISPSISLAISLTIYLSVCPSIYFSICLSVHLSMYLSIYLIISLFIYITSEPPKVARTCCALYILTWKCASRHSGAHFFNIRTSKSGASMWCFVHFDLEMCFAPLRRAPFRHLNFQKWSGPGVLCTFWLQNVLRATKACTFSTSQLPKVVREWCVLYILTSKCASRHYGVHFFDISTSKSGPTMVCFVHFDLEMCFAPQRRAIFHHSSGQLAPHPPL